MPAETTTPRVRKTTIQEVTIISPEDKNFGSYSLHDIARELDDGESVGDYSATSSEGIEGEEAIRKECEEVGHDGSLFVGGPRLDRFKFG